MLALDTAEECTAAATIGEGQHGHSARSMRSVHRGLVILIVIALAVATLLSYRSKALADAERRFHEKYR